jgi:hypothetical protein
VYAQPGSGSGGAESGRKPTVWTHPQLACPFFENPSKEGGGLQRSIFHRTNTQQRGSFFFFSLA